MGASGAPLIRDRSGPIQDAIESVQESADRLSAGKDLLGIESL
jgi:hypothetical protein